VPPPKHTKVTVKSQGPITTLDDRSEEALYSTRVRADALSRFLNPGPAPRVPDGELLSRQDRAHLGDDLHDWTMRDLIHRAVHMNDPLARADLASSVCWMLNQGLPIRDSVREWLSFVLRQLMIRDQIPHLAKGNAIKSTSSFVRELAEFMRDLPPNEPVTKRLESASRTLNVSFGKARAAYYSDDFKRWARFARVAPRAGDFVGLEQVEKRMELVRAERQRQRKARGLPDLD